MPEQSIRTVRLEIRGNLRTFFNGMKDSEIVLDGPAGTGKTRIILERQHYILNKYPLARGLMLRQTRSSMTQTCMQIFRDEVLGGKEDGSGPEGVRWRERDQQWEYPNGSVWVVGGMDDTTKVMSSMYDFAYWNELIEGKESSWEDVSSRLRNFKVPYQQLIGDTNPGPPSHWIKRRADKGQLNLLPTFHKDNPVYWNSAYNLSKSGMDVFEIAHVMQLDETLAAKQIKSKKHEWNWTRKGLAYVENTLKKGLTGLRHKRLYEGKWVAAEGQVYPMWDPDVHVIKRFPIPRHWHRYWGIDFGYIDPFVWQEWVEDPDTGSIILNKEYYKSQITVNDACKVIRNNTDQPPMAIICDHDAEDRATLEQNLGVLTLPAFKSISPGIQAVQHRMVPSPILGTPRMFLFEDASLTVDPVMLERKKPTSFKEEVEAYVWDTGKIAQDKYKDLPVDRDNHGCDIARYMVAFLDDIAIDPSEREEIIPYNDDEDMVRISDY